MKRQALVIGLGQFGMALARSLSELDCEVLAVDRSADRTRAAASFVDAVSCIDATDESALGSLAPKRRDVCVCAIGDESRESSIICTALLRQMGAPYVVARATDSLHERILGLIGAHEVVNPERDVGQRVARRIAFHSIMGEFPLGNDLLVSELETPGAFAGRTLAELALPAKYNVMVIAVRNGDGIELPAADTRVDTDDVLVVVSHPGAVTKMLSSV